MTFRIAGATLFGSLLATTAAAGQSSPSSCFATATSMTPASWRAPSRPSQTAPIPGFKLVREIPLPGPANRFDYQSVDPASGRIYMNHMNAGTTLVLDEDSG